MNGAANAIESMLAANERLEHNLAVTEQTMREYQELAAKRLEEIERLKDLCTTMDGQLGKRPCQNNRCLEYNRLAAELAKYRDAPIAAYGVLEDQGSSVISWDFIAGWPEAAHEHINDAIQIWKDSGDFVPKYSVVPLIVKPGEEK